MGGGSEELEAYKAVVGGEGVVIGRKRGGDWAVKEWHNSGRGFALACLRSRLKPSALAAAMSEARASSEGAVYSPSGQ